MKKSSLNTLHPLLLAVLFLCFFTFPGFCQPEIPIDAQLKDSGESWNVKIKQKLTGYKPAFVAFGPVKTIETSAGKAKQLSRVSERDLFWKNIKTTESRESSMVLVFNETDTVSVNLLTVTREERHVRNVSGLLFDKDKDQTPSGSSSGLIQEMTIELPGNGAIGRFIKTDSLQLNRTGCTGILVFATDSFFIRPIGNFSGRSSNEMMLLQPATGYTFLQDQKQVAALQTLLKTKAWISKEISGSVREALLSAIVAFLGVIKAENGNGF